MAAHLSHLLTTFRMPNIKFLRYLLQNIVKIYGTRRANKSMIIVFIVQSDYSYILPSSSYFGSFVPENISWIPSSQTSYRILSKTTKFILYVFRFRSDCNYISVVRFVRLILNFLNVSLKTP